MTPTPTDAHAWTTLHHAATAIVERLQTGQLPTADQLVALTAAVEDVDAVLFSDWWEREQADKAARSTDAHD